MNFSPLSKLIYFGCFLYSLQLNHNFLAALVSLGSSPVPYGCWGMQRDANTEQSPAVGSCWGPRSVSLVSCLAGGVWDILTPVHSLFPPSLVLPRENSPPVTLLVWLVGVQAELADCPLPPHHINPNLASKSSKRYKKLKS